MLFQKRKINHELLSNALFNLPIEYQTTTDILEALTEEKQLQELSHSILRDNYNVLIRFRVFLWRKMWVDGAKVFNTNERACFYYKSKEVTQNQKRNFLAFHRKAQLNVHQFLQNIEAEKIALAKQGYNLVWKNKEDFALQFVTTSGAKLSLGPHNLGEYVLINKLISNLDIDYYEKVYYAIKQEVIFKQTVVRMAQESLAKSEKELEGVREGLVALQEKKYVQPEEELPPQEATPPQEEIVNLVEEDNLDE